MSSSIMYLLAASLLAATCCPSLAGAPGDCAEINATDIERLVPPELSLDMDAIIITDFHIVCSVAGRVRNTFLQVSLVVEYNCTGSNCSVSVPGAEGTFLSQLDFRCMFGSWGGGGQLRPVADATLQTSPEVRCGSCLGFQVETETHCTPCNSSCLSPPNGLGLCSDLGLFDCCNFYFRDQCMTACPPGYVPNLENFTCDATVLHIGFQESSYSVSEDAGTSGGAVCLNYTIENLPADTNLFSDLLLFVESVFLPGGANSSDITPINDIVNVNPVVESTTCVFVQINNDEVSEPNEVFQLQLVLRSNGPLPFSVMIFRNTTLFTIVDDDRPEPFEVICVRQDVQDTSTLFYNCGVQPPLSGVTLSCDIDGKPLESCEALRIDPRLYEAGVSFLITVIATDSDGRTNSTSIDFMGTGPDMIIVSMSPRMITIAERFSFNSIGINVFGPGSPPPTVFVNLRPLTYGQYAALGGNVDQEFPSRPPAAAQNQSDFNSDVMQVRVQGTFFVALDDLVLADQLGEPDEGFILYLEIDTERTTLGRGNTSVIVVNNNATLVIIQDVLTIGFNSTDYTINEGGSVVFTIIKQGANAIPVSVTFSTSDGTASAGSDYVGDNGTTVTFGPNDTSITVTIPTIDDDVYELEETFLGVLRSDTDTLLGISMASATIIDMDTLTIGFNSTDYTINEGGSVVFTIIKQGANAIPVFVTFSTSDGTALAGSDYVHDGGTTVTFEPNDTSITVITPTVDDGVCELAETFLGQLVTSDPGVTLGVSQATATINDMDTLSIQFDPVIYTVTEGVSGMLRLVIIGQACAPVSVSLSTGQRLDTASAPADYTSIASMTVTFSPGQTEAFVPFSTLNDSLLEGNESFSAVISNAPARVGFEASTAIVIIKERGCPFFTCGFERTCIPMEHVCDDIPDCVSGIDESNCTLDEKTCMEGAVRLSGQRVNTNEGLLEVCNNGEYGTVCSLGWGLVDSAVVCRQLGLPAAGVPVLASERFMLSGEGRIIHCNGTDRELTSCPSSVPGSNPFFPCNHFNDVGLICQEPDPCDDGDVRLVGGPSNREGRVEICMRGIWGGVVGGSFPEASIVCRQLGFDPLGAVISPFRSDAYGGRTDVVLLRSPDCSGANLSSSSLLDCLGDSRNLLTRFNPDALLAVRCDEVPKSMCTDGDVQLIQRSTPSSGLLYLCSGGMWGTVCGLSLPSGSSPSADVACRQLNLGSGFWLPGFEGQTETFLQLRDNIPIHSQFSNSNVACNGSENSILECPTSLPLPPPTPLSKKRDIGHSRAKRQGNGGIPLPDMTDCSHNTDIGLRCLSPPVIRLSPSSFNGVYNVYAGRRYRLECTTDSGSVTSFRVNANIGPTGPATNRAMVIDAPTGIKLSDSGQYCCNASSTNRDQPILTSSRCLSVNVTVPSGPGSSALLRMSLPEISRLDMLLDLGEDFFLMALQDFVLMVTPEEENVQQTVLCNYIKREELDASRGLERIECNITIYPPRNAIAFAKSLISPLDLIPNVGRVQVFDGNVPLCPPEVLSTASGSYSWLVTSASDMSTLPCPMGPVNVNATRQCDAQGNWLDHDASLCVDEFDLIVTEPITIQTYEAMVGRLLAAVQRSVPSEQNVQNVDNTASFLNAIAKLLLANATASVSPEVVDDVVGIISGIQNWPPESVQGQGSNIVMNVESIFQSVVTRENFTLVEVVDTNFAFRGERINMTNFILEGRSFSTSRSGIAGNLSVAVGGSSQNSLTENEVSVISLSSESILDLSGDVINFVFTIYRESTLFPIEANRNSTIATTILGAFIPNVDTTSLNSPANISFRLNNQTTNVTNPTCVSWDFNINGGLGGWSPEGCEIVVNQTDPSEVMCSCNHLTNFAVLVDICSRTGCDPIPPGLALALDILSIIGVSLSLFGVVATVITLLVFKKLRNRDATKFHVQLCAALFCMLLVFVIGIDRTEIYGGCVTVSVLIHYFTLVAVMWMGAEAVLMFQKLVIVFTQITTRYIIAVSIICWSVPLIPVIIPLAVNTDFMVSFNDMGELQFCFIGHTAVFFGAFLAPIFAIILFNTVMFAVVIFVLLKHTISTSRRVKDDAMKTATVVRLLISISGVMFLFGLTWLFGALTVTGATLAFQIIFAIFNSLQGFFIFLFFCVFSKDARELWKETLSCGRYRSSTLHPSQPKSTTSSSPGLKTKRTNTSDLATTSYATSTLGKTVQSESSEDTSHYVELPVTDGVDEKSRHSIGDPTMTTFTGSPPPVAVKPQEIPVHMDGEGDVAVVHESKSRHSLGDPTTDTFVASATLDEQKQSDEENEKADSSKSNSPEANGHFPESDEPSSLKARVQRYSTKKQYKHHVEQMEVDFSDEEDCSDFELGPGDV